MHLERALTDYTERDWERDVEGTVRFALVGLGWWTVDVVLPALEPAPHCEVTVLVSGTSEKASDLAEDHDALGCDYDAFHDGAHADAYDAVYVGTPNAAHLEYVETAASLGKDVLCEKPLEATVERGERLVEAAEDITLMTAYRMQTDPAVRRARELLQAGAIGEPVLAQGVNTQRLLAMNDDPDQWRLDPEMAGYGTSVMDLGIYPINTARYVLEREPVAARASMRSPSSAFADVPDEYATFSLAFDGGLELSCVTSQNAATDSRLTVLGTEGHLELHPAFHGEARLTLERAGTSLTLDPSLDIEGEMREEFEYFAQLLLAEEPVHPDGTHGLADLRTIASIYDAASAGGWVDI